MGQEEVINIWIETSQMLVLETYPISLVRFAGLENWNWQKQIAKIECIATTGAFGYSQKKHVLPTKRKIFCTGSQVILRIETHESLSDDARIRIEREK